MPNKVPNKMNNFIHEHIYHLTDQDPTVSFCSKCCSVSISTETETVSTVKPNSYITFVKNDPTVIFSQPPTASFSKNLPRKIEYLKIRQGIIKEMKQLAHRHSLQYKTFFASIYYLDTICSKLLYYEYEAIRLMGMFCLVLSSKFWEDGEKGYEVEKFYSKTISTNYISDEIFVLKLLDYNLAVTTAYDYLISMLQIGFVFENETVNPKKMNFIYSHIEKMLYGFIESKNYIDMTQKEIAFGIIGFSRESMKIDAFPDKLMKIYGKNYCKNEFFGILSKIKKCLKIKKQKSNSPNVNVRDVMNNNSKQKM